MIFRSRLTFLFCFILTFRANTKKLPQSESKNRDFCSDLLVFLIVQRPVSYTHLTLPTNREV